MIDENTTEGLDPWINEMKPIPAPIQESGSSLLKTNYKDLIKRYEIAERVVWHKLPDWKKEAIIKCKVEGIYDDRIFTEYSKDIISLAEDEKIVFNDTFPPVPQILADKATLTK